VKKEVRIFAMRVSIDMIDSLGIKRIGTAFDAVNFVALFLVKTSLSRSHYGE
jgi:hypothetical protein